MRELEGEGKEAGFGGTGEGASLSEEQDYRVGGEGIYH